MKEDEDIETMFSRFQTGVSDHQVLNKSYTTSNHVNKILRSLHFKWGLTVTAIQEANYFNKLILDNFISLKSHEMELIGNKPAKKSKSIAMESMEKYVKTLQVVESEDEVPCEGYWPMSWVCQQDCNI